MHKWYNINEQGRYKAESCIIRGEKFSPPSLFRNNNQFNEVHGNTQHEPTKEWTRTSPAAQLKSPNSTTRSSTDKINSPIVSDIIGKLNHYAVDNGDIEVYPSDSMIYPDKTPIKSEDNNKMNRILEFLHL